MFVAGERREQESTHTHTHTHILLCDSVGDMVRIASGTGFMVVLVCGNIRKTLADF